MSMIQCLVAAKTAYEIQKLQEIAVTAAAAQAAFFIAMMHNLSLEITGQRGKPSCSG